MEPKHSEASRTRLVSDGGPLMVKMEKRSSSCPCVSPQMVMRQPSGMSISWIVDSEPAKVRKFSRISSAYLRCTRRPHSACWPTQLAPTLTHPRTLT
jgi:hypothetical protein